MAHEVEASIEMEPAEERSLGPQYHLPADPEARQRRAVTAHDLAPDSASRRGLPTASRSPSWPPQAPRPASTLPGLSKSPTPMGRGFTR